MVLASLLVAGFVLASPLQTPSVELKTTMDLLVHAPFKPTTSLNELMSQQLNDPRVLAEIKVTDQQIASANKRTMTAIFSVMSMIASQNSEGRQAPVLEALKPYENNGYSLDMFTANQKLALRKHTLKNRAFASMFTTEVQLALNLRSDQIATLTALGKKKAEEAGKKREKDAKLLSLIQTLAKLQKEEIAPPENPMSLVIDAMQRSMEIEQAIDRANRVRLEAAAISILDAKQRVRRQELLSGL